MTEESRQDIQEALHYFTAKVKDLNAKGKRLLVDFDPPVSRVRCGQCDYPFGLHDKASHDRLRACPKHRPGGTHA